MNEFIKKLIERLEEKRDKAVEWAHDAFSGSPSVYNYTGMANAYRHAIEIVNQLAEEYNQDLIKVSQDWIACRKEEPKKDGYFLITTSDGEIDVREYSYSKGWGWDGFERVIAWMPLPAPYQPEGVE